MVRTATIALADDVVWRSALTAFFECADMQVAHKFDDAHFVRDVVLFRDAVDVRSADLAWPFTLIEDDAIAEPAFKQELVRWRIQDDCLNSTL